jgi:hypothetical protein
MMLTSSSNALVVMHQLFVLLHANGEMDSTLMELQLLQELIQELIFHFQEISNMMDHANHYQSPSQQLTKTFAINLLIQLNAQQLCASGKMLLQSTQHQPVENASKDQPQPSSLKSKPALHLLIQNLAIQLNACGKETMTMLQSTQYQLVENASH